MRINPWDKAKEVYKCEHTDREFRYRILSNGAKSYYQQCTLCGDMGQMIKKMSIPPETVLGVLDEKLAEIHYQKISNYANALNESQKELETAERKRNYHEYLDSPEWKHKRSLVLDRDAYICQSCLISKATMVHHLTYKHIYREPLFDLVSVCRECHEMIHQEEND